MDAAEPRGGRMIVGVPKEIKPGETRVAILPAGVQALREIRRPVWVQAGAGWLSGISDEEYRQAGARIVRSAAEIWRRCDLLLKVKEPVGAEISRIREGQILFTYLHLAANRSLTEALLRRKCIAIGYETVQTDDGQLPLLIPMSEVAGKLAVQAGAYYLQERKERPGGKLHGRGVLMSGLPGVSPAEVVILGGGIVGTNAAKVAVGLGARVTVIDRDLRKLRYLDDLLGSSVHTLVSTSYNIQRAVREADLLIGAVLIPGARAPRLVTRAMVRKMRRDAVIVDVAVDQGGCVETIRPTTHDRPIYEWGGVLHYGVTNMPAAVPRTSTVALTNATLPYVLALARQGFAGAVRADRSLGRGVNLYRGRVVHAGVGSTFRLPSADLLRLL